MDKQKGQSLLEILIAITLGLLICGFCLEVFQSIRATSLVTEKIIEKQEVGLTSFQLLRQDLKSRTCEVLDPQLIPADIASQTKPGSNILFFQCGDHKIIYWLGQKDGELHRRDLSLDSRNQTAVLNDIKQFTVNYFAFNDQQQLQKYPQSAVTNWPAVCLVDFNIVYQQDKKDTLFHFILGVRSCAKKVLS